MATPALAAASNTAADIIALERNALESGDAKAFVKLSAPDVSYLDPGLDKPIKGVEALAKFYAGFPADTDPAPGEMSNATVQEMGDIAVLSFHYVAHKGGRREMFWNCTEVYRKTEAGWRIVNTHWSLTKPPKKD